jgi:hypothetical protein
MLSAALQRSRAALLNVLSALDSASPPGAAVAAAAAWPTAAFSTATATTTAPPLYAALGVHQSATQQEIKAAFRRMAKQVHPDATRHRQKKGFGSSHRHPTPNPTTKPTTGAPAATDPQDELAAAAAFLRIVEAYEVLGDPGRRQAYDASVDVGLPGVLRSAAGAATWGRQQQQQQQQQQHGSGGGSQAETGTTDPGWRYGFNAWARDGPARGAAAAAPMRQGPHARVHGLSAAGSVYDALERYRDTLEADLHAALLHAFFGPR